MSGLIIWTVACIGIGVSLTMHTDRKPLGTPHNLAAGLGMACLLWAVGVGIWEVVGVVVS